MTVRRTLHSLIFTLFLILGQTVLGQRINPLLAEDPSQQRVWVDSVYNTLSIEQKVGQLFMIGMPTGETDAAVETASYLIEEYQLGGVLFSQAYPYRQAQLTNQLQAVSNIPLLVAMDAEWGLATTLDSTVAYPYNMTLGAIQDDRLIEQTGAAVGADLKRIGVHLNLAPVLDLNTNPNNPIIGSRSYGENKYRVTNKAHAFLKGMNREGVLSAGKHFPGHGETSTASFNSLPTIPFSKARLDSVELYPYDQLIDQGLAAVLVGHLHVPALERSQLLPASLSRNVVTNLLQQEIGFQGLIITDALSMDGANINAAPGGTSLAAFLAGNDILLMPGDIVKAVEGLVAAVNNGVIREERLQRSVKKILSAKYKVGLHKHQPVDTNYLVEELNIIHNRALNHQLFEAAQTLVQNRGNLLPIADLHSTRIAYINLGDGNADPFYNQLTKYARVDWLKSTSIKELQSRLDQYNLVIIGYHKKRERPWDPYEISQEDLRWLEEVADKNRVVLSLFTSPYVLQQLMDPGKIEAITVGYQNDPLAQEKAAQMIFGAVAASGTLPVSASMRFREGGGIETASLGRLSYGLPEHVGMNTAKLKRVDSIVDVAINQKMTPGAQVLVARKGKVIYNSSAGYHTYDQKIPVADTDLYDLASLTKILGSLPLLMELVDQGVVDLDTQIQEMLPRFRGSNKASIRLQPLLSHYARLQPWIPFHWETLERRTNNLLPGFYSSTSTPGFSTPVAEGLFIRDDMQDTILKIIRESALQPRLEYRYSDLPYYLLKEFMEEHYGASLDSLTRSHFFRPLGAHYLTYLPLEHFPKEQIVPTEHDRAWRKQLLQGYVHDEGAALIGGVAGHAGLFGSANDIAKMMQMYLNGGHYGGRRYLSQETIDLFNTCYYCSNNVRRGIGFDKPQLRGSGPVCACVSRSSFGHSGFTGTFTWADPQHEIVYVFLSNRIHPTAENRKLIQESIRIQVQEAIYDAIDY